MGTSSHDSRQTSSLTRYYRKDTIESFTPITVLLEGGPTIGDIGSRRV